jgi:hypothetical protein
MELEYIAFVIIIILTLYFLYNNCQKDDAESDTNENEHYKTIASKDISYPYNDDPKYLGEYNWVFGGWPFWYNRVTPLPFNNPTRYYGYKTTLYPLIHDYYYPGIRYY